MSDVDRLFACFKCGLTPPKSATRERKRSRGSLEQESSESPDPGSVGEELKTPLSRIKKTNIESSIEKLKSALAKKAQSIGHGKQFSPIVFYGSPHGVLPKRPTRMLWRLLREICPDLSPKKTLNVRKEVWMTFPRQDEAIKFCKGQADVHVFSYQDHFNGQRRFLVSTYTEFWRRYKNMNPKFRHHYEVIQEGLPCHLYFDLEFNKKVNKEKNGEEMVDLLISMVLEALHEKYAIQGDHDWVLELDSSTEDKFSRHVIVCIPKAAFKDNSHAGAFVSEICSRVRKAREKDKSFDKLFVMKDSSSEESADQLFVDTAVYSRNRCFRLVFSSKAGKISVLLPTKRFKCKDLGEEDMFMASLIGNIDVDCQTYLVCKTDLDCVKTLHFDTEESSNVKNPCQNLREFTLDTSDLSTTYFMGKSPFPFLDKFILSVASVGNIPVIYVVDLRMAVYYQKCHDPDCRGYRSPSRPVPVHVFSNPSDVIDSSFGLLDGEQLVDNKWRHQLDDNKEQNSLQYDDIVEDNSSDSWWLEAIRVAEDMESKQTKTELSTMDVIDDEDEEWWLAVENTASQAELASFSQQEFCAM